MFNRFKLWLVQDVLDSVYAKGYNASVEHRAAEKLKSDIFSLEEDLNKKVIYCPNEWEDPLFGTIVDVTYVTKAKQPMGVVKCVLTAETGLVHPGGYLLADGRLVDAILKLNPLERWNLTKHWPSSNKWTKSHYEDECSDPEELRNKLLMAGFIYDVRD